MFERFTTGARLAVSRSRQEAERLQHEYIDARHLLLALLRPPAPGLAGVLAKLAVDWPRLVTAIEATLVPGSAPLARSNKQFTRNAVIAFERAQRLAAETSQDWIGVEHLLVGAVGSVTASDPDLGSAFAACSLQLEALSGLLFPAAEDRAGAIALVEDMQRRVDAVLARVGKREEAEQRGIAGVLRGLQGECERAAVALRLLS